MEPSEQQGLDRAEYLVRVTELEDEVIALEGEHRRVRLGILVGLVMLVGSAIGSLGGATGWVWALVGGLVLAPWALRASRAAMRRITERKEGLQLQMGEVKRRGSLTPADDATVEPSPQDGSEVAS